MTLDLHTDKDSLAANKLASPHSKNSSNERPITNLQVRTKGYNVNIPKTIGNTSSIRVGGKSKQVKAISPEKRSSRNR